MIRQQQLAYEQVRMLSQKIRQAADDVAAEIGDLNAEEHLYALRAMVEEYEAEAKALFLSGRGSEKVPVERILQRR